MKKIILFACALIGATASQAQGSIQFLDRNDNNIDYSGTTVQVGVHAASESDIHKDFDIKNNSGATLSVSMKRYELTVDAGTINYFCFVSCTQENTAGVLPYTVDGSSSISAGANSIFYLAAHHKPEGIVNSSSNNSKYMYVAYDDNNPSDSSWVIVHFNVATVGVEENNIGSLNNAYPNPATNNVTFNFEIEESNNNKIVIYDMLGAKVDELNVKGNAHNYNIKALKAGVYFYALEVNGKATKTKKLVIK